MQLQEILVPLSVFSRFQEELPAAISARSQRSLTHAELVKIMEWKLTVSTIEIDSHST